MAYAPHAFPREGTAPGRQALEFRLDGGDPDETEVPRLIEGSLDRSLRILTGLAKQDPDIALVLVQVFYKPVKIFVKRWLGRSLKSDLCTASKKKILNQILKF